MLSLRVFIACLHGLLAAKSLPRHYTHLVVLKDSVSMASGVKHVEHIKALHAEAFGDSSYIWETQKRPEVTAHYSELGIYAIYTTEDFIEQVRQHDDVQYAARETFIKLATLDHERPRHPLTPRTEPILGHNVHVSFSLYNDGLTTQINAPTNLARLSHRNLSSASWHQYTYNSKAIATPTVYIIDSGVDASHSAFEGRMSYGVTFREADDGSLDYKDGERQRDDADHGTGVASVILGKYFGVARSALGVSIKLAAKTEDPLEYVVGNKDTIAALTYVLRRPGDPRLKIVNLSISTTYDLTLDTAITRAIYLYEMHVVVAAGNQGDDLEEIRRSPARSSSALSVGSIDPRDERSWFSNYGPNVEFAAPGEDVIVASSNNLTSYDYCSGTSYSAPLVSGLVAYLLSIKGPMHPEDMRSLLHEYATVEASGFPPSQKVMVVYNGSGY